MIYMQASVPYRVQHRYKFTQGFQVTDHVGMGMVPNLGMSQVLTVLQFIWWVHRPHFNFRVLLGVAG